MKFEFFSQKETNDLLPILSATDCRKRKELINMFLSKYPNRNRESVQNKLTNLRKGLKQKTKKPFKQATIPLSAFTGKRGAVHSVSVDHSTGNLVITYK